LKLNYQLTLEIEEVWAYIQEKERILKKYTEQKRELVVEKVVYCIVILSVAKNILDKVNSGTRNMVRHDR